MKSFSWFSPPTDDMNGYGYVASVLVPAINTLGVAVWFDNREQQHHISFSQPEFYTGHPDQYRIGYTPWESTGLATTWPGLMAEQDEIWTTSTFCKEVFESHGVQDVWVLPHGIEEEVYSIVEREVGDKFRFLHIGSPASRKGVQRVIDAFLDLFDGQDDYQLIIKARGYTEGRIYVNDTLMYPNHHPQIVVIEHDYDKYALANLYHDCHCLVYPTNGEGWGLIPWQGIATGMPTICTNATGCRDFAEMSVPLDFQWGEGNGIHLGDWAIPDEDDLRDKMRYVADNWAKEKMRAMQAAKRIHATQTWDHIAVQVLDRLF